ncbi:MAG: serine/threonine protein kinase [Clostridia bacterium]|nr:serine/threonine protein kinase [Clostridia bacterium]
MRNGTDKMTREQYLESLLQIYLIVKVLSDKNGCRVLRLRNKISNRDLVLRLSETPSSVYEELCRLKYHGLPEVYDVKTLSDGQAVLEEYIDGMTVADVMLSGRYTYLGVKKIMRSLCGALGVLHERNIVHRDIKPENIMVDNNGEVVLIDFNVSRRVTEASHDTVVMGTVGYAAPEQLGVAQSDPRTDIYALGVLLNVMLTGKHPSEQIARGKAGRVIRKCTAVNPDERFQTVGEFLKELN